MKRTPKIRKRKTRIFILAVILVLLILPAVSVYYVTPEGESCARCHEIQPAYNTWQASTHREIGCKACHGGPLTLDPAFHLTNLRRLVTHVRGDVPEQARVKNRDINGLVERCRVCHQQEFADWEAGPHSVTYATLFLDETHNRQQLLMDDCLRCHGMYYEGGIRDLVTPIETAGPWQLIDSALADQPAIPCLACHEIHTEGQVLSEFVARTEINGASQELHRPSVALFDRRAVMHISASRLPMPDMRDGDEQVPISPDLRQTLCYQCHAPISTFQTGSGDDRSCVGVHEGISCLACHQGHRQWTRASCATCHPRWSNCGLDVETMDTTFRSPDSPHDIHSVKCIDCHRDGVPLKPDRIAKQG